MWQEQAKKTGAAQRGEGGGARIGSGHHWRGPLYCINVAHPKRVCIFLSPSQLRTPQASTARLWYRAAGRRTRGDTPPLRGAGLGTFPAFAVGRWARVCFTPFLFAGLAPTPRPKVTMCLGRGACDLNFGGNIPGAGWPGRPPRSRFPNFAQER